MPATNAARAVPARFDASQQHRRAMYAKINIARQRLNMEEDDYRQGLFTATGRTSLKDCSEPQLARMLDWLKSKGFKAIEQKGRADTPMAKKARALWISLAQLGVVHNPSEQALEAFAKRQLGCDKLIWARQSDAYRLIEGLKSMAERAGWLQRCRVTGKKLTPAVLQISLCQLILAKLKAAGALPERMELNQAVEHFLGADAGGGGPFTAELYARLAVVLGARLREIAPAGSVQ